MKRIFLTVIATAFTLWTITTAYADGSDGVSMEDGYTVTEEIRAKIEPIVRAQGADIHYFPGPDGLIGIGMTNWKGEQSIAWATSEGEQLIGGIMVDTATETNLTQWYATEKLPKPDLSEFLEEVASTTSGPEQGNPEAETEFFVFVDPTCPACQKEFSAFQALLGTASESIRVRWIPVGILGPAGQNRASATLGKGDQGFWLLQAFFAKQQVPVTAEDVAKGQAAHAENLAMFRKLKFDGVPSMVSRVNGEYTIKTGMTDMNKLRAALQEASSNVAAVGASGQ